MGRAEALVERYLLDRVEELGGITRKVTYQGRQGSPDRWCFFPKGKLLIIECKSAIGGLSRQQAVEIDTLKSFGQKVHVVNSIEQIDEVLSAV